MSRVREERDRELNGGEEGGRERSRSPQPDRGYDASMPLTGNGGRGEVRPGDWTCENCGVNVFASKLACFRCRQPKPGVEPDRMMYHAGQMGGDQNARPGDWTCNNCGANVFASKTSCFRCQAPKPGPYIAGGFGAQGKRGPIPQGKLKCQALALLFAHFLPAVLYACRLLSCVPTERFAHP